VTGFSQGGPPTTADIVDIGVPGSQNVTAARPSHLKIAECYHCAIRDRRCRRSLVAADSDVRAGTSGFAVVGEPSGERSRYERDAEVLTRIGAALASQPISLTLRIPADLAGEALAAWEREEDGQSDRETPAQRNARLKVCLAGAYRPVRGADRTP
jgi:hypothetical protein